MPEKDPNVWTWIVGLLWSSLAAVTAYTHTSKLSKREYDKTKEEEEKAWAAIAKNNADQHGHFGEILAENKHDIVGIKDVMEKVNINLAEINVKLKHRRIDREQ